MVDSDGYERDELDDIIDGSSSETSMSRSTTASSIASSMFDKYHFVLELHDLQKEELPLEKRPDSRAKKFTKKTKGPAFTKKSESSDSSETDDEYSLTPTHASKEQFFDAHESYYGLPAKDNIKNENVVTDISKVREMKVVTDPPERHPHLPQIGIMIPESIQKGEDSVNIFQPTNEPKSEGLPAKRSTLNSRSLIRNQTI